jgi:Cu+-exporting ATPase
MKTIIDIEGMTCAHCVARVGGALTGAGATGVKVDLLNHRAEVDAGSVSEQTARDAITEAGYTVTGMTEAWNLKL